MKKTVARVWGASVGFVFPSPTQQADPQQAQEKAVGDRSGSGAAGRRGSDPATRGSAAAAAIADIFSIPALPES